MMIAILKKRIEGLERRRVLARETEASRKLRARLAAASRRMRQFRPPGEFHLASDEEVCLPPIRAGALRGLTGIEILNRNLQRGREQNHRHWLAKTGSQDPRDPEK